MKQKLGILALVLCGAVYLQTQMPAIDPSGKIAVEKAQKQNDGKLPHTGLIADPSGMAIYRAAHP